MIAYLKGKILDISESRATLLPEGTGLGYLVHFASGSRTDSLVVGQMVEFWIHSHIREDAFDLYGFLTKDEKDIFQTLLTVNGIGPKGAMGILSKVEVPTLVQAILEEDQAMLTQVPGIGKKTAERVVVELRDAMRKRAEAGKLPASWLSAAVKVGASQPVPSANSARFAMVTFFEAKDALIGLGYKESMVVQILKQIEAKSKKGDSEESSAAIRTEDLVKQALKELR